MAAYIIKGISKNLPFPLQSICKMLIWRGIQGEVEKERGFLEMPYNKSNKLFKSQAYIKGWAILLFRLPLSKEWDFNTNFFTGRGTNNQDASTTSGPMFYIDQTNVMNNIFFII